MSRPAVPPRPAASASPISTKQSNTLSSISNNLSSLPASFSLPDYYHFPPLFTLQRNADTRVKQLQLWCDLLISLAQTISTDQSINQSSPFIAPSPAGIQQSLSARSLLIQNSSQTTIGANMLFENKQINRSLNNQSINEVCQSLIRSGHAVWLSGSQTSLLVTHQSIDQWATLLSSWASEFGLQIVTLYEIQSSSSSRGTSHFGLHAEILHAALETLQSRGKCQLIPGDTMSEMGVKFKGS